MPALASPTGRACVSWRSTPETSQDARAATQCRPCGIHLLQPTGEVGTTLSLAVMEVLPDRYDY